MAARHYQTYFNEGRIFIENLAFSADNDGVLSRIVSKEKIEEAIDEVVSVVRKFVS